jgi:hypothetical protein
MPMYHNFGNDMEAQSSNFITHVALNCKAISFFFLRRIILSLVIEENARKPTGNLHEGHFLIV